MYRDIKFLLNTTALYLGIQCLEDRKLLTVTEPMKTEFLKLQNFFKLNEREIMKDEKAFEYYKALNRITLGEKV